MQHYPTELAIVHVNAAPRGTINLSRSALHYSKFLQQRLRRSCPYHQSSSPTHPQITLRFLVNVLSFLLLNLIITKSHDATDLKAIASKKFTAVEVAITFSKWTIIAYQLTCCLT